jgi:hypothetical protein
LPPVSIGLYTSSYGFRISSPGSRADGFAP